MLDIILEVAHEHQVTGLVPAIMQGMVINMAENGTGADPVCPILGVDEFAKALHQHCRIFPLVFCLVLFGLKQAENVN